MTQRASLAFIVAGACLVLGIAAGLLGSASVKSVERPSLARELPMQIADWRGEEVPLGDNEVTNATTRLLNYDDYVYRVYRRNGAEVYVYAMYWRQGSISVREIAGHTPDGCWIANGAQYCAPKQQRTFVVGNQVTPVGEWRDFVFPNHQRVSAVWWHLWGDNLVDRSFDQKALGPTFRELWVWLVQRRGERRDQLLVRIHTTGNLIDNMHSAPVKAFLDKFPELYLAKPL